MTIGKRLTFDGRYVQNLRRNSNFLGIQQNLGQCVIPQRYILCFMTFMGITMACSMRACLNIAITKMVMPIIRSQAEIQRAHDTVCPGESPDIIPDGGKFNWSEQEQGIALAAFFPGYVVSHIPGGIAADKLGGKHIFSAGVAISAILTILVPVTVEYGSWWGLTILRIIIGFSQGPLFPSMTRLLSRWAPPRERGRLVTFVTTGAQVGTITGNLVSSLLIAYAGGWTTVFYFWGALSLGWYLLFIFLCYSEPYQHPFITEVEVLMLTNEIGTQTTFKIPWKKIFLHRPVWALILAEVGHDCIFFLVVVEVPKYMSDVLKFNIKENGISNALPYVALIICCSLSGVVADCVINRNIMTVLNTRLLFTTIGKIGPGICIVLVSYMGCNGIAASAMFVLCMITMGPFYAGMRVNAFDITKTFVGVVMGIVNGAGAAAFIPVPYIVAMLTSNYALEEWRRVFWVVFAICVITDIGYVVWASVERAEWDKSPSES